MDCIGRVIRVSMALFSEGHAMFARHLVITANACVALLLSQLSQALPIADSIAEFSGTQAQDGWSYGLYNRTAGGPYTPAGFVAFDTFDGSTWRASDAQVGANNNDFLNLNSVGGHPNGIGPSPQTANIWAVRRYASELAGLISIGFDLRKVNTVNPNGGGITGRIFVDGVEVFTRFIANADGVGVQDSIVRQVAVGSLIDFVIDPLGIAPGTGDGAESARADGSHFSAVIGLAPIAEPGSLALVLGASLAACSARRRQRSKEHRPA